MLSSTHQPARSDDIQFYSMSTHFEDAQRMDSDDDDATQLGEYDDSTQQLRDDDATQHPQDTTDAVAEQECMSTPPMSDGEEDGDRDAPANAARRALYQVVKEHIDSTADGYLRSGLSLPAIKRLKMTAKRAVIRMKGPKSTSAWPYGPMTFVPVVYHDEGELDHNTALQRDARIAIQCEDTFRAAYVQYRAGGKALKRKRAKVLRQAESDVCKAIEDAGLSDFVNKTLY